MINNKNKKEKNKRTRVVVSLLLLSIVIPNSLIWIFKYFVEKNSNSRPVSSLRDCQTDLDPG